MTDAELDEPRFGDRLEDLFDVDGGEEPLGEGANGIVHRCRLRPGVTPDQAMEILGYPAGTRLPGRLIVKSVKKEEIERARRDAGEDPSSVSWKREWDALAALRHSPFVVTVLKLFIAADDEDEDEGAPAAAGGGGGTGAADASSLVITSVRIVMEEAPGCGDPAGFSRLKQVRDMFPGCRGDAVAPHFLKGEFGSSAELFRYVRTRQIAREATGASTLLDEHSMRLIMWQLLSACAVMHETEPPLVHRDIKPENIFVYASRVEHAEVADDGTLVPIAAAARAAGGAGTKRGLDAAGAASTPAGGGRVRVEDAAAVGGSGEGAEGGGGAAPAPAARPRIAVRFPRIKLGDMGFARTLSPGGAAGATVDRGTAQYMAPEVARAHPPRCACPAHAALATTSGGFGSGVVRRAYTTKVDIFSCGVVLYVIAAETFPFTQGTEPLNDVRRYLPRQCAGEWTRQWLQAAVDAGRFSPAGVALVDAMLQPDPARRPTAREALAHGWFSPIRGLVSKPGFWDDA